MLKSKNRNIYLIILLSIVLLGCGVVFGMSNLSYKNNNINNVVEEEDSIGIEKEEIKVDVIQDVVDEAIDKDIKEEVKVDDAKDIYEDVKIVDSIEEEKEEVIEDKLERQEDNITSMEKTNDDIRNSIKSTYGVVVGYKDEIEGNYTNSYATPTREYDDDIINQELHKIESALAKYPSGFFLEICNKWKQLSIYLVKSINSSDAGLTDDGYSDKVIILIDTGGILFESTLHHEIMHYIDCYLANIVGATYLEESMNKFNPDGFIYGNQSNDYVYYYATTAYFLSSYSKIDYKEDRAVLFADMMYRPIRKDYFNNGNPISNKMKEICKELDEYFDTVSSDNIETWERFLEW